MNIEDRLESIDTSLKTLVTILQSQGAITAVAGAPEATAAAPAAESKKTTARKTKDEPVVKADLVAGDPEGTRYWTSDEAQTAYAQKPGDPDPKDHSFKIQSSAYYLTKKAEYAKNAEAAAASQPTATTEPSATAQPDTASDVDWDTVFREIKALSTDPKGGREAVLGVLKHFGCEGKTVPALKDLNKNAEIVAHVKGLLAPVQDSDLGL